MFVRALVLLLLVCNLAVALWWWLRPLPEPPLPPATEAGVEPLRLLSEVEGGSSAELAAAPERSSASGEQCLEVGPFLTRTDLRRAFNALVPVALRIQYREATVQSDRGWWVFLPAPATREQALDAARALSARGLRDYYVVTAGENANTISLGLFRERENAEQRLAEVRAQGFAADLAPRVEAVQQYWIGIAIPPDTDWRARLGGYTGVEARTIGCF